jgi:hypothetical protein
MWNLPRDSGSALLEDDEALTWDVKRDFNAVM